MERQSANRRTGASCGGTTRNFSVKRMRRRALLAGTALATAFMVSNPVPAAAQVTIITSTGPVNFTKNTDCLFLVTCLSVTTVNPFFSAPIRLTNNGDLAATGPVAGTIFATTTFSPNSPINLTNNGDLAALALVAAGISTYTGGNGSRIAITNTGDIATLGAGAAGIVGITGGSRSHVNVTNNGDVATVGFNAYGVYAYTYGPNSNI